MFGLDAVKLPKPGIGGIRLMQPRVILRQMYTGVMKQNLLDLKNKHDGELRNVLVSIRKKTDIIVNKPLKAQLQKLWQPVWNINARAVAATNKAIAAYQAIVKTIAQHGDGQDTPPAMLAGLDEVNAKVLREFTKIEPIEDAALTFSYAYRDAQVASREAEVAVDELHDRLYNVDKKREANKIIYAIAAIAVLGGGYAIFKTVDWKNLFSSKK